MAYWRPLPTKDVAIGGFRGLHESLTSTVRPLGSVSSVSNMLLDPAPTLKTRPGLTALGSAISAAVTRGIGQYINLSGTTVQTLAQAGTQLSYTTGSAWTSISNAMPNKNFTAANLNDYLCIFYAGSAAQRWNGSALAALGGSPPQGEFVCEAHSKLFVCGIPTREGDVDWCDDLDPETWTPLPTNTAGSATVSTSATKWIAHDEMRDKVLIWTTRNLHVLLGPETPDNPSLWDINTLSEYGTPNGRTVQNAKGTWIWLTSNKEKGFVMFGDGVRVVYDPIKTSVDLIDWSNIANACSWFDERGRYNCSVPKSGGRIVFTYDPITGEWTTGTNGDFRASGIVRVNGVDVPIVGNEVGQICKVTGTSDAGSAISYEVVIGPSTLGENFRNKELTEACLVLSAESGATVNMAVATSESGSYGTTKSLTVSTGFQFQRIPLPVSTSDVQRAGLFRVKVWGTGVVQLHDLELTTYYNGR